MIKYQVYKGKDGYGRALILFWGLLTIEWVLITVNGFHLSTGVKIFDVGASLTLHT